MLRAEHRAGVAELIPVLRRVVQLDAGALARLLLGAQTATVLVRLPFGVLASRTVHTAQFVADPQIAADPQLLGTPPLDTTVRASDALAWFDDATVAPPAARDAEWRAARPPDSGWRRVETVPDDVVRGLVRKGALALKDAAAREGLDTVPRPQPRAEVADALLDAVVLTARDESGTKAEVTLRALSALVRMGFLPRGGEIHIDIAGRWTRVVAGYGTVYLERADLVLTMR